MPKVTVMRNAGHPWDARHGFDLMGVNFETERERDEWVKAAESKFWKPWIVGFDCTPDGSIDSSKPSAMFYKPSGIQKPWIDSPDRMHPGCLNGVELPPDTRAYAHRIADQAERMEQFRLANQQLAADGPPTFVAERARA